MRKTQGQNITSKERSKSGITVVDRILNDQSNLLKNLQTLQNEEVVFTPTPGSPFSSKDEDDNPFYQADLEVKL